MSTTPDGEYKWVLLIVDHFSKPPSSFSLRSKHAVDVAEKLHCGLVYLVRHTYYSVIMVQSCRHWAQALPEIALPMNHQMQSTIGESPYRAVSKQMRMQRLSFADRVAAIPEDGDLGGSDAGDGECDSEHLNGTKT